MITLNQRRALQRAITTRVKAERWLADEESESQRRGQTQFLNAARRERDKADDALRRALDRITTSTPAN